VSKSVNVIASTLDYAPRFADQLVSFPTYRLLPAIDREKVIRQPIKSGFCSEIKKGVRPK
jgi:hypothetical protein